MIGPKLLLITTLRWTIILEGKESIGWSSSGYSYYHIRSKYSIGLKLSLNDKTDDLLSEESILDDTIDSFLSGDFPLPKNSPIPSSSLEPGVAVDIALTSLRKMDEEGAAVLMKFCCPLHSSEFWRSTNGSVEESCWKEIIKGSLNPLMLYRRLQSSRFNVLLNWKNMSVTEGYSNSSFGRAFVNVALFFEDGIDMSPVLIQFSMKNIGEVWLIDNAEFSKEELFYQDQ